VRAERALMRRLEGGCQVPIAACGNHVSMTYASGRQAESLELTAFVGSLDGQRQVRDHLVGSPAAPEALGEELAERLLAAGADRLLAEVRGG
jgi:hydroxymethylbilane synthase